MTSRRTREVICSLLLALMYMASSTKAFAATTNNWTNSMSGLWRTGSNWSSNQAPNATFTYILITNANTKTVTIDAATPSTNLSIQRLIVSAPAGTTNTLWLVDLTTNVPLQLSSTLTVDRGGVLCLTNSALTSAGVTVDHGSALNVTNSLVRESGFANFDIVNGSTWLENGLLDCSAIQSVRLGRTNGSAGIGGLTVNGGTLLAPQMQIGSTTGSAGTLALNSGAIQASQLQVGSGNSSLGTVIVSGGVFTVTNLFTLGLGSGATGTVSVVGGQIVATNGISDVGGSSSTGVGQLNVGGGNATFAFLAVGPNGNGQVSVTSGQLTVLPRTTNDWTQVGHLGIGQLNISGGSVVVLSEFHVGDDDSGFNTGSGTVAMTGGQLIATNDLVAIGRFGVGQMSVSNAMVLLTNVSVGRHPGSDGTLTVQSNAQVFLQDALSIGRFSNSMGQVIVSGGLLSLTNDALWVGREGTGSLIVSNGTVLAKELFVGLTDDGTNIPFGTVALAGGTVLVSQSCIVGAALLSTGQVVAAGGNLAVTNSSGTAYVSVVNGSFTLNSGTLAADQVVLTNASGQFTFNGGTLQAKSMLVSNGAPFVVGDGVDPATLQMEGGTFVFANGLVVSSKATLTGCGTIIGPITNNGTITTNCPVAIKITSIQKSGPTVTLAFTTASGSNHVVEYKNSLLATNWTALLPGLVGTGMVMTNQDTNAAAPSRFYRIHVH